MNTETVQRMTIATQVHLVDGERTGTRGDVLTTISGRAVPYGTWANSGYRLVSFAPGSLDKSIKEAARSLPLLLWHDDRSWPIGSAVDWQSGPDGLDGTWRLDDSPEAQRAGRMARDGFLTGMSVGVVPVRSDHDFARDWDLDNEAQMDRVTYQEARLVETSLVYAGVFADALVTFVGHGAARQRPDRPALAHWREVRATLAP